MIRIATALALLLALGHEAAANPQSKAPRLKELVSVTSEVVRIMALPQRIRLEVACSIWSAALMTLPFIS